jgi:nitroreductase
LPSCAVCAPCANSDQIRSRSRSCTPFWKSRGWSGSAGNRQPWEFVVVRDRDLLRRLSAIDGANAGHLATAAAGIAIGIHPEVPDLDAYDEGRLAERILLAAAAQGVGAAVGHFTGPGDTWAASAEAKRMLGIPEQFVLRETISLGYPAEHLQRTPNPPGRKPLEQLVHWEHY